MNTSGVQEVHSYVMPAMKINEKVPLVFLGDIHWGTKMMSTAAWKNFLLWGRAHPKARYIGMGDYLDMGSASERSAMMRMGNEVHEQTRDSIESMSIGQVKQFCKEISFMRERTIAMLDGNHFMPDKSGVTMTQRICDYLGCFWGGVSDFITLEIPVSGKNCRVTCDIWAHHGRGASRRTGGSINSVDDMRNTYTGDIYAQGHDHQKWAVGKSRLYTIKSPGGERIVRDKKELLIRTGSFLRGYVKGHESYVTEGMFPPSMLGCMVVTLTVTREREGGVDRLSLVPTAEV